MFLQVEWEHKCENSELNSIVKYQQNWISFSSLSQRIRLHIPLGA